MKRVFILTALALLASVPILASPAIEAEIKARADEFAAAWNKHDTKAMADMWSTDGDLINPYGRVAKGRAEVEKLFLDVCNWLLGRDDLLARESVRWQYPRVALPASENALWQWGTRLGMPVLFVYLGLVVLMVRRLR